jgi:antitoxin ParD1/3/4
MAVMEDLIMATMNISLPDAMKTWAEQQAESGRYSNTSDYVRDLIRKDQDRRQKIEQLQALVSAGIASGEGTRSMDELKAAARQLAMDGKIDELHSQQES